MAKPDRIRQSFGVCTVARSRAADPNELRAVELRYLAAGWPAIADRETRRPWFPPLSLPDPELEPEPEPDPRQRDLLRPTPPVVVQSRLRL